MLRLFLNIPFLVYLGSRWKELYSAHCYILAHVSYTYFPWPFRLHMVRLMLLERLLQTLPQLRNVGGVRAIPYMQVSLGSPGSAIFPWGCTSLPEDLEALCGIGSQKDRVQVLSCKFQPFSLQMKRLRARENFF